MDADEIDRLLGRMTRQAGGLELVLLMMAAGFVTDDPAAGQIAFAGQPVGTLIDRLRALVLVSTDEGPNREQLLAWLAAAQAVTRRRNDLIHSALALDPDGQHTRIRITARGKWKWATTEWRADELVDLVEEFARVNLLWRDEIIGALSEPDVRWLGESG